MVTFTNRNSVCMVRLISLVKWLLFMIFLQKKGHFFLFFTLTYIGHFLSNFHFFKNILMVDGIVHSLIYFHMEILKNKVRTISRNMQVHHMWLQIAPLSKCWMPLLTWDVYYSGPHVYLADDDTDDQNRRQEEIWNDGQQVSESSSDWVCHWMRERVT